LPDIATEDAAFGTQIHDALAKQDSSGLDGEQLKIYEQCVEMVEKLTEQFFGPEANDLKRWVEQRFWVKIKGQWEHSGKPDLVLRSPTKALAIEYKTLPGEVGGVAENAQLRDQIVFAGRHLLADVVGGAIVQPLVTMSPSIVLYDKDSIAKAEAEMFARVEASNTPDAPRVAGESQCKFCKARHECKEHQRLVAVSVPALPMHELALVSVKDWTPEQRAQFCEAMPIATKWIEEVKKQIKASLTENPESVPGYKLEPGDMMRPISDPEALHQRFVAAGGNSADFLKCVEVGKGDFEKAVRAATGLKGKGLKAKMDELLSGLTEDKQKDASIAKAK
jgi:hypothetical protein